ncbi:hypothetical protein FRB98_003523 [Tulasnella sp. 332]|nr:hypothetical protein FRB98_003523 [Tulasnella sp. 332]
MPPATNSSSTLLNDPAFVSTSTLNGPNALQLYDAANDKYTEPHRPSRQHGTIRTMNRVSIEQPAQAHIGVTQRQPLPTVAMPTDPYQLNSLNKPVDGNGERSWSYGLCGCFNTCRSTGVCCVASWLPCFIYGANKTRLEHLERHGMPEPDAGQWCGRDAWCYGSLYACFAIGWVLQIGERSETRRHYHVRGWSGFDCLAAYFCTPCALTQEHREIELEENAIIQRLESGEGVNPAEPRQPPRQQSMMQAGSGLPLESSEKNRNNGQDR